MTNQKNFGDYLDYKKKIIPKIVGLNEYSNVPKPRKVRKPKTKKPISIILPANQHSSYSYPDLEVSLNTSNPIEEKLASEDSFMLNLRQFIDFLKLLRSDKIIYDSKGKPLDPKIREGALEKIIGKRAHTREERLDNTMYFIGDRIFVGYHVINSEGHLERVKEELDKESFIHYERERYVLVNLDHFLENSTYQGFLKNSSTVRRGANQPRKKEIVYGNVYPFIKHHDMVEFGGTLGGISFRANSRGPIIEFSRRQGKIRSVKVRS